MRNRNEIASSLVECLKEVRALLSHAHSVALNQQEALVKNDAEAITATYKAHEEVLRRIGEADQRAASLATEMANADNIDLETAGAGKIVEIAGELYGPQIEHELERIATLAKQVKSANEVNRMLLENGLDIIACCLRTVAQDNGPTGYSQNASVKNAEPCILSLDKRA